MRVVIAGGTGQIGNVLSKSLVADGHEVIVLSRSPQKPSRLPEAVNIVGWDGKTVKDWASHVDGADAVINLAGANIAGDGFFPSRWSDERKKLLLDSRVVPGKALVEAIKQASVKPKVLVQISAVGYYGQLDDRKVTESDPAGDDFLARICIEWEKATAGVEEFGVRHVVVRMGVVLDFNEGALYRMALPFKLFAGGPMGSGNQYLAWVHPEDAVGGIRFAIENEAASGAFNLTGPETTTNKEFSRALGRAMSRPSFMPVPGFAMKLMFGEVSDVLLTGQRVIPKRLQEMGYTFKYPDADSALRDLAAKA